MREIDPRQVALAARILGPQSAAAKALLEHEFRRGTNEDVRIHLAGSSYVVGPPVPVPDEGPARGRGTGKKSDG